MPIVLNLNKSVLDAYLRSPSGDVWVWLERKGNKAVTGARRQVGVKTGLLRTSIRMTHRATPVGQELMIGSDVKYAFAHHEGTKPHVIAPKSGGVLVLGKGRVLRGPVMHPGTKPNRFLSDQLWHFRY
jgi:hypothetical protein